MPHVRDTPLQAMKRQKQLKQYDHSKKYTNQCLMMHNR
jgi:hypothetical protein